MRGSGRNHTTNGHGISTMIICSIPPRLKGETEYTIQLLNSLSLFEEISLIDVLTFKMKIGTRQDDRQIFPNQKIRIRRVLSSAPVARFFNGFIASFVIVRRHVDVVHLINPFDRNDYGGALGEGLIPFLITTKLLKLPVVISIHTPYLHSDIRNRIKLKIHNKLLSHLLEILIESTLHFMFMLSSKLLLVSSENKDMKLFERFKNDYNISDNKLSFEEHPYLKADVYEREPLYLTSHIANEYALCFGFLREEKGFHLAIQAWHLAQKDLKQLQLLIVGPVGNEDGEKYLKYLQNLVLELDLSQSVIIVPRLLPAEELKWLCVNSKFIILPYINIQGPSGTAMDARLSGVPIVATDIPVLRNQLADTDVIWTKATSNDLSKAILQANDLNKLRKNPLSNQFKNGIMKTSEAILKIYESSIGDQ